MVSDIFPPADQHYSDDNFMLFVNDTIIDNVGYHKSIMIRRGFCKKRFKYSSLIILKGTVLTHLLRISL